MELAAGDRARTLSHPRAARPFPAVCTKAEKADPLREGEGQGPAGSRGRAWTDREKLPWCWPVSWFLLPNPCKLHFLPLGVQKHLKHSPNITSFTAQTGLTGFHSPVANWPLIRTLPKCRCHYSEMLCCTENLQTVLWSQFQAQGGVWRSCILAAPMELGLHLSRGHGMGFSSMEWAI